MPNSKRNTLKARLKEVQNKESQTLRECPFCGGEPLLEVDLVRKGFEARVTCCTCLVAMPTITYETEREAIESATNAWNRRVQK